MIAERSEQTSRLIEALTKLEPGQQVTYVTLMEAAGTKSYIYGFLASARRYIASRYAIYFHTLRGIGLQRMVPGDITAAYPGKFKKAERHFKRAGKQLGDEPVAELTKEQRNAHAIYSAMNAQVLNSVSARELDRRTEIAKVDGVARALAAIESVQRWKLAALTSQAETGQ